MGCEFLCWFIGALFLKCRLSCKCCLVTCWVGPGGCSGCPFDNGSLRLDLLGNHFISDFIAHRVCEIVWKMEKTARWIRALFAFICAAAAEEGELVGSCGVWDDWTGVEQLCCWVSCDLIENCFSLLCWLAGDVVN